MPTTRPLRAVLRAVLAGGCGLVLALGGAGCTATADGAGPRPAPPAATVAGGVATDPAAALAQLDGLGRQARPRGTAGYERDAFGSPWSDTDANGCNQRDDVLLRDAVTGTARVQQQGGCDHDVLGGSWVDPYTGAELGFDDLKDPAQAQALQIDHVVPLAEAWVSGAAAWSAGRRASYANDLDGLLAVDGPTNAAKGADDPAAWRPRAGHQCAYAVRWVTTKARWQLVADPAEVRALREMLQACP